MLNSGKKFTFKLRWPSPIYLLPVGVFLILSVMVVRHTTIFFDAPIINFLGHARSANFTVLFKLFTDIGSTGTIIVALVTLAFALLPRRKHIELALIASSVGGAVILNTVLKLLFARARPQNLVHLVSESSFSFPSGHSMASSALAIACIYLAWRTKARWLVIVLAVLYCVGVGMSRVYLGVHYPSDVVAGWCASWLWVGFIAHWFVSSGRLERQTRRG